MGFQSSFNQALGTLAGAALGAKHIKGQKESLKEQKMQGQFNVEREVEREKQHKGKDHDMITSYFLETGNLPNMNEIMADRAGQALANETTSKGNTSKAVQLPNHKAWLRQYMDWYGVGVVEAMKAYDENAMSITANNDKVIEKVLSTDSDELLNKEKNYRGGNK